MRGLWSKLRGQPQTDSEPLTPERIRAVLEPDIRWQAARRRWAEVSRIDVEDVPDNYDPAICVVLTALGYRWNGAEWVMDDELR